MIKLGLGEDIRERAVLGEKMAPSVKVVAGTCTTEN
jgi:hypothetical protein